MRMRTSTSLLSGVFVGVRVGSKLDRLSVCLTKMKSRAVQNLGTKKALGTNSFAIAFFQVQYNTIKDDLVIIFKEVYINCKVGSMNSASITWSIRKIILLKCLITTLLVQLCVYKIISKVLSQRLNKILEEMISFHQSEFTPGRGGERTLGASLFC